MQQQIRSHFRGKDYFGSSKSPSKADRLLFNYITTANTSALDFISHFEGLFLGKSVKFCGFAPQKNKPGEFTSLMQVDSFFPVELETPKLQLSSVGFFGTKLCDRRSGI